MQNGKAGIGDLMIFKCDRLSHLKKAQPVPCASDLVAGGEKRRVAHFL